MISLQGPIANIDLLNLPERDSDEDILAENEFPYMSSRLKEIDYKKIIKKGVPWEDPYFPKGRYSLFMNHQTPAKQNENSKAKWLKFKWRRASEYFENNYPGQEFHVFDGVDPSDVIMGSCNDCYAFAALAGMAEAHVDEAGLTVQEKGQRVRDNFLTKEINDAGCYALTFIIDGQPRKVVVDDYFPFTKTKAGKEVFAFAKCKHGENEIWV